MKRVHILVGTEMGTAQEVAGAVKDKLDAGGFEAIVNPLPEVSDIVDNPDDIILVCTSNTGAGDLPSNIEPFYRELVSQPPNIAGRRYGLINLGDSSYPTFGEAGQAMDDALADIGAVRIGEPLVLDACMGDDPIELTMEWLPGWMEQL